MEKIIDHIYLLTTVIFTVYSQFIMRWQVSLAGAMPVDDVEKIKYVFNLLLNGWVLSGIVSTLFAGVSWMLAMTKFELSYAYPFVSLNYVFVLLGAIFLFNESLSLPKIAGCALVVLGIIVISKG